jgi:hypothetical protein
VRTQFAGNCETLAAGSCAVGDMPPAPVYSCFSFRLASDIRLDELHEATLGDPRPLVRIRRGAVPQRLRGGGRSFDGLQVAADDALLTLPGVARFLIRGGQEIVVDPHPGVTERTLRLFLLGSVLGILCHQRGLLPLHANAVVASGRAFAFAGESGAGKSTLAAEFEKRGYRLLADDVCMVDFDERGAALAWPGIPRLKLWADAAVRFGHDCSGLDRVLDDAPKFQVPSIAHADCGPVPLRRLYLLSRTAEGVEGGIERLRGHRAMAAIMAHTYRGFCLGPLGLGARHFRHCAELLDSVPVYTAARRWGFDCFEQEVDRLEAQLFEEDSE